MAWPSSVFLEVVHTWRRVGVTAASSEWSTAISWMREEVSPLLPRMIRVSVSTSASVSEVSAEPRLTEVPHLPQDSQPDHWSYIST